MDQWLTLGVLLSTLALFAWGRWRHDMVAVAALLVSVILGLVPAPEAFTGFSHPAVITVACVLVITSGLQRSGAVDALARRLLPQSAGRFTSIASLTVVAAALSAFMNNVGALALLMPIALQIAKRQSLAPGQVLMPLAYGSILGGMSTLIGTPPNLIVAGFRAQSGQAAFVMFDFTPVGSLVAVLGILFIVAIGWRLVPVRAPSGAEGFEIGTYLTEARVPEKSPAVGKTLREIGGELTKADAQVLGIIRDEFRISGPSPYREVHVGDILVVEADPDALPTALVRLGLKLEEAVPPVHHEESPRSDSSRALAPQVAAGSSSDAAERIRKAMQSGDVTLMELAVLPNAHLDGLSATDVRLRNRYGVNLLAVSRQGRRSTSRLRTMPIRSGDLLLMQGTPEAIAEFAGAFGCVPLAERALHIPNRRRAVLATSILALAIALTASGVLAAAIAFAGAVFAYLALRVVSTRDVYNAIDWPVIVLLGALIPVANAIERSGAAETAATFLIERVAQGNVTLAVALVLIVTMTLSDFVNNAATAALMCPIALGAALTLGVSPDPFLMAVAVGASCAFLTPIGHQNNTLILGPGGFRFGDYWRLGLPLEVIVVLVATPAILWVWPI